MKFDTQALRKADVRNEYGVFTAEFDGLSWPGLLAYYQTRSHVRFFPAPVGKAKHAALADRILTNDFEFNHERHRLEENFDWTLNPSKDIEWHILLHKFYYLKELAGAYAYTRDERYAQKWMSLTISWIEQVPDGFIDSQVTGRRLQQWLNAFHAFVCEYRSPSVTSQFLERFILSVNSQTLYLCEHLTPEGNHRTLELYAIFLAAVTFPELRLSSWFLEFSKAKLLENMRTDLLPDGVHRELSTDYHHTVLKNYLRFKELAGLNAITLPNECDALLKKAIEFSCYVHKPDGFIPAINDGDCNSYLGLLKKTLGYYPNDFVRYVTSQGREGGPPGYRSRGFADSGYYLLRSDWMGQDYKDARYLFFDCGQLGFGSHGHYDLMNIEVAAFGRSLIVDPGRFTYHENGNADPNWRHYFKGTAGHNTVVIDGLDQIRYRAGKPVDREPQVELIRFIPAEGFDFIHGRVISHHYPAVHERMVFFANPEYWIVADHLQAKENHDYDLYFHLSFLAQGQVSMESGQEGVVINSPNLLIAQPYQPDTKVSIEQGYVSPEYGVKHEAPVVKFSKAQAESTGFYTVLYPYKDQCPSLKIRHAPVYRDGGLCEEAEATALRIDITTEEGSYTDYFFFNRGGLRGEFLFDELSCTGLLMYVRFDDANRIVNLQGEGIDFLAYRPELLCHAAAKPLRLSYRNQVLTVFDGHNTWLFRITDLTGQGLSYLGLNQDGIERCFK